MPYVRLVFPVVLLGLVTGCIHRDRDISGSARPGASQPVQYVAPSMPETIQATDVQHTAVGQQAQEIRAGVDRLNSDLDQRQKSLADLKSGRSSSATDYFNRIAAINSRLQAGTTAANPNLVAQWKMARADLTTMEGQVSKLSEVSAGLTDDAAVGLYLSNQIRSTLALPGAVDEDHVELNKLSGETSILQVQISQTLGEALTEINRQNEVLSVEYRNIATTSHAIEVGQILGDSLASIPMGPPPSEMRFSMPSGTVVRSGIPTMSGGSDDATAPRHFRKKRASAVAFSKHRRRRSLSLGASASGAKASAAPSGKPIIVISGDPHENSFEDRLYTAVSAALEHSPTARFDVRAVALSQGSSARWAIQAVELEQKANTVARSLTAYGLPRSRISISQGSDSNLQTGEIQVYVR